ncbi:DUF599 domain-containing protein [Sedimentitalea nanhaiensis]|uniref:Uncharacterized membrane protein n=1 Tax=Sedimentitalea nanhaiensis TaxID=999627 RepID=A0A1I7DTS1_9RHOB|nr:DUF599 domain-containing protein [Sedimentitalea nanhaiensis]SFU15045.1 Uncharacterized membrane protein [Sedimentitalea nanhaiensis]
MTLHQTLTLFSPLDFAAIALLLGGAWLIGWRIENPPANRPSVSILMAAFRRDWMKHMVLREPRVFDAQLIGSLRQGTTFFASATMIAIGGGLAAAGNTEQVAGLVTDLTQGNAPTIVWEIKILVVLVLLANAFLKFVWAHRLFGYCAVLMAAVPNDCTSPLAYPRATQAADISITAARSFNRAMRSTYFALAAMAWLLGPAALAIAAALTVAMLYRREFHSHSRKIMLRVPPDTDS